jgi:ABC-type multidrug transport system ATPase subunit
MFTHFRIFYACTGKTALLRTLSGRHPTGGAADPIKHDTLGRVTYAGRTATQLANEHDIMISRLAAYSPQDSVFEASLSVRETLMFAHSLYTPQPHASENLAAWTSRVDGVIASLGLSECADMAVGSPQQRGISGGQRKRLTLALALLSDARVLALDGATTGIDAPRALAIVSHLRTHVRESGATAIIALESPTPEVLALFDAVIVMAEGRELYHGPPACLQAYMFSLGFVLPRHMDLADFAMHFATSPEVAARLHLGHTTPSTTAGRDHASPHSPPPPVVSTNTHVMSAIWRMSAWGRALVNPHSHNLPAPDATTDSISHGMLRSAVAQIDRLLAGHAHSKASSNINQGTADATFAAASIQTFDNDALWSKYRRPSLFHLPSVFWILLQREGMLMLRNRLLFAFKMIQALVCGMILGAVMWQLEKKFAFSRRVGVFEASCPVRILVKPSLTAFSDAG